MKIRLQEIELGTNDPDKSKLFYNSILGLETAVDQAELKVFNSGVAGIIFNPIDEPRKGWEKAFKQMHENGDDELLMDDVFEDENFEEWNK